MRNKKFFSSKICNQTRLHRSLPEFPISQHYYFTLQTKFTATIQAIKSSSQRERAHKTGNFHETQLTNDSGGTHG